MNIKELIADLQLHFPASGPKEVADALLAQQACIEQMRSAFRGVIYDEGIGPIAEKMKIAEEALALQPSLDALREHDANIRNESYRQALFDAADDFEMGATADDIRSNAERIRKGEV